LFDVVIEVIEEEDGAIPAGQLEVDFEQGEKRFHR